MKSSSNSTSALAGPHVEAPPRMWSWLGKAVVGIVLTFIVAATAVSLHSQADYFLGYDFLAFYASGRIVNHYGANRLYDINLQRTIHKELDPSSDRRSLWPFLNLPFVAILFAPLARVPLREAYFLWMIVNLLLLVAAMCILTWEPASGWKTVPKWRAVSTALRVNFNSFASLERKALCIIGTLALAPTAWALANGQLSFVVMLLLALFFKDLTVARDRRAGIWLGLLAVKQQLLVGPLLLLAFKGRWRVLVTAALVLLSLLLISYAMAGPAGMRGYMGVMGLGLSNDPSLSIFAESQHNWRGFLLRSGLEGIPLAVGAALASAATIGVLLWIWRGEWRPNGFRLTALILTTLLVAPHGHWQEWALLGLIFALFVGDPGSSGLGRVESLMRSGERDATALRALPDGASLNVKSWLLVFSLSIYTSLAANVFTLWRFSLVHFGAVAALIIMTFGESEPKEEPPS